jgi:hypothetical protein
VLLLDSDRLSSETSAVASVALPDEVVLVSVTAVVSLEAFDVSLGDVVCETVFVNAGTSGVM